MAVLPLRQPKYLWSRFRPLDLATSQRRGCLRHSHAHTPHTHTHTHPLHTSPAQHSSTVLSLARPPPITPHFRFSPDGFSLAIREPPLLFQASICSPPPQTIAPLPKARTAASRLSTPHPFVLLPSQSRSPASTRSLGSLSKVFNGPPQATTKTTTHLHLHLLPLDQCLVTSPSPNCSPSSTRDATLLNLSTR